MLRLHQIKLTVTQAGQLDPDVCRTLAAQHLKLPSAEVVSASISKRSIDARGRNDVHFTLTLDVKLSSAKLEQSTLRRFQPNQAALIDENSLVRQDVFDMPHTAYPTARSRPVVIGAGPAGLFCALGLAIRGAKPLLLERGKPVEQRTADVAAMETSGILDPESNVLFGEGGAGAFSDGKLTCGLNDPYIRIVLQTLVTCGAPEDITIAAKPHIGTDLLRGVLTNARRRLISLGGEVLFAHKAKGLDVQSSTVKGVHVVSLANGDTFTIATDAAFLAIGHSARDTYAWLSAMGVPMQAKPFAMGVRIEHTQAMIDRSQYGDMAGTHGLPPAEYKINVPTPDGRGAYTFCMCPGGQVMNASSEPEMLNVNGMSLHARNAENANSALLIGIRPSDFGSDDPLAGIELQRSIERAAYRMGDGYRTPAQRVGDFLQGKPSNAFGSVHPSYRPGVYPADISRCLPDYVADYLRFALPRLGDRLHGFADPDAVLTAPETRSSSPVRLLRNEHRQSALAGLYPLGEGAGYAGGIVSAAVDGLKAALDA